MSFPSKLSKKQKQALLKGQLIRSACGAIAMMNSLEWNLNKHLPEAENLKEIVSSARFDFRVLEDLIRRLDYNKLKGL